MLEIVPIVVTPFLQNCRILGDTEQKNAVVIDPGGDVPLIEAELARRGWRCIEIWLTHSHLDHCGGVSSLKAKTNAKLFAHPIEKVMRAHVREMCEMYGLPPGVLDDCPEPEQFLTGGELLNFAGQQFKVMFTPGHSPGHVVFYEPELQVLIAGDTLFLGSIGRTDIPGGDHRTLIESIQSHILTLPDETRVLPGHGEDTTVGFERMNNPFLQGSYDV